MMVSYQDGYRMKPIDIKFDDLIGGFLFFPEEKNKREKVSLEEDQILIWAFLTGHVNVVSCCSLGDSIRTQSSTWPKTLDSGTH
jgi:hypothetical protein